MGTIGVFVPAGAVPVPVPTLLVGPPDAAVPALLQVSREIGYGGSLMVEETAALVMDFVVRKAVVVKLEGSKSSVMLVDGSRGRLEV